MKYFFLLLINVALSAKLLANDFELEVVSESWPPYIIPGKEITGVVTEKVTAILNSTDINYQINVYPWARSYHLATSKPNVLIYSIYRTQKREALFHWFCPIHQSTPIHIYKLATNKTNVNSMAALKSAVVGIMRGDNSHKYLLEQGFEDGINLDVSADEKTNIIKLINGRVDVVVQSQESLRYRLAALGAENQEIVSGLTLHHGENAQHCMALSKGSKPEIIEKISKAFASWQAGQRRDSKG